MADKEQQQAAAAGALPAPPRAYATVQPGVPAATTVHAPVAVEEPVGRHPKARCPQCDKALEPYEGPNAHKAGSLECGTCQRRYRRGVDL